MLEFDLVWWMICGLARLIHRLGDFGLAEVV